MKKGGVGLEGGRCMIIYYGPVRYGTVRYGNGTSGLDDR